MGLRMFVEIMITMLSTSNVLGTWEPESRWILGSCVPFKTKLDKVSKVISRKHPEEYEDQIHLKIFCAAKMTQ